jgi:hypothetical protein
MASTSAAPGTIRSSAMYQRSDNATSRSVGFGFPRWVYLIISLIALLAVELGFRLARNGRRSPPEAQEPVGAIVGAILGLLAFLLAFTFGLAATLDHG